METLGAFFDAAAARAPEREAVSYAPSNRVTARQSWAELRAASRLAAKRLVAVGNDPYPYSAARTPTLVFEGVTFAGV